VDDVIMFDQLNQTAIFKIIDLELANLYKRIGNLGFTIDLSDEAKQFIAEKGYDVQLGARPLKRAIQRYLEDSLSEKLLSDEIHKGDVVHVELDKEKQELVLETKR